MNEQIKIAAICGSLRQKSYNMYALLAVRALLPPNFSLEIVDISHLPLFSEDIEANPPKSVLDFEAGLRGADAFLIATPEYNFSFSGVLKNALDWASRFNPLPLAGKPLGIISASLGAFGGMRAQYHLRQVAVSLDLLPLNKPEVFITSAHNKFDEDGNLADEKTRTFLIRLISKLENAVKIQKNEFNFNKGD